MAIPEKNTPKEKFSHYQIKVEGIVNATWSDWFGGMKITSGIEANGNQVTILNGTFPDQSALRGVLIKLWDLNATLIEVQLINPNTGDSFNLMEVKK